ncbi:hypothetical protein [Streptomyces sp. NPDC059176]|uniref:hypothetical protein n=1 Tax=unclassified Streptomyces TaxID=2593676 RepID=UPI00369AF786
MTTGRGVQALRAAVFAAVCVLLTALGHAAMSGVAVPVRAVAAAFVLTAGGAWALARRERGLFAVTSSAVAAQAVLHAWYSLGQVVSGPAAVGGPSRLLQWIQYVTCGAVEVPAPATVDVHLTGAHTTGTPAMGMRDMGAHHMAVHDMSGPAHDMSSAGHHMAGMSPAGMLALHVLAALLSGLWLAHGERAVGRLRTTARARSAFHALRELPGRIAASLTLLLRPPVLPVGPDRDRHREADERAPRLLLLVSVITSRGPPVAPAVV